MKVLSLFAPLAFLVTLAAAGPIPDNNTSPNPLHRRQGWNGGGVACYPNDWNCYCYYYPRTQACYQRNCYNGPQTDWQCYCWAYPGDQRCHPRPPTCEPNDWYCYCYYHRGDSRCNGGQCQGPWDRNCCNDRGRWSRHCCGPRDNDPRCRWGGFGATPEISAADTKKSS